jgi:hypothetical protein
MRLRRFLWLIALTAFVILPFGLETGSASAHGQGTIEAMTDCPDHAPPPKPCPAQGTAKHTAGDCCPAMSGSLAVLPPAPDDAASIHGAGYAPSLTPVLHTIDLTKDPPPPRG